MPENSCTWIKEVCNDQNIINNIMGTCAKVNVGVLFSSGSIFITLSAKRKCFHIYVQEIGINIFPFFHLFHKDPLEDGQTNNCCPALKCDASYS